MRAGSKHRGVKQFVFSDFTGGVNFALSPEMLKANEAVAIENFEFDLENAVLKVRDGLELFATASDNIDTLYYSQSLNLLLFSLQGNLYKCDESGNIAFAGALSGSKTPAFCEWDNKVLIASGGYLQVYDGTNLVTIDTNMPYPSPMCDCVNVINGRVVVSSAEDDNIYFSGVGDETNWNFEGTDSDALQIEIGYKDSGGIVAIVPYTKDLLIFKNSRNIYRLVGWYPDWLVYKVASKNTCISRSAAVNFGNHVIFVDKDGVKSIETVQAYGDMKVFDIGTKINPRLVNNIQVANDVRLWHLQPKGQIWLKVKGDPFVYVYHYFVGAWTTFIFPDNPSGVAADDKDIFVAINSNIYRMKQQADDNGESIRARLVTKKILCGLNSFLIKFIRLYFRNFLKGYVTLKVGNIYRQFEATDKPDIVYSDTDIAYFDDDPLVLQTTKSVQLRTNHRVNDLQVELVTNDAVVGINGIILNVAEV